jgi:hypothetical protein
VVDPGREDARIVLPGVLVAAEVGENHAPKDVAQLIRVRPPVPPLVKDAKAQTVDPPVASIVGSIAEAVAGNAVKAAVPVARGPLTPLARLSLRSW